MKPQIIAQSGTTRYLVQVSETECRIISIMDRIVGPRLNLAVVIMNGVWNPIENQPDILKASHDYTWQKIPKEVP